MALSPVIGLDIGTFQMKAVELNPSAKEGLVITNVAFAPTPPGIIENGIVTDPRLLGQSVKQMLKDSGFKSRKVIGSVAGQSSVVVRIIEVPKMNPQELAETMKWEVERHVPFAPSDVQMDYVPLPQFDGGEENPNMAVLLAVAQKEMITNYIDMLFAAGLDPIALDIEPLASGRSALDILGGRAVVHTPPPPVDEYDPEYVPQENTIAIVNIGASNTDISIFENDQLIFPRSLSLAGDSITRQISESLGYTPDQAEQIKREHGGIILERVEAYDAYNEEENQQPVEEVEPEPDYSNMRVAGLPDSGPIGTHSPFDVVEETADEHTLEFSSTTSPTMPLDLERTQPIMRRTIDLARRTPPPDASSLLTGLGGEDSMKEQVFDAILPVLSELATELRRSLDYYRSRSQGRNVDRIMLCGGTASLPGLDEFLSRELQIPVEVQNPFANLSVTAKGFDPDYLTSIAPLFSIAVGLAARDSIFAANPTLAPAPGKAGKAPKAPKEPKPGKDGGAAKPKFSFGKKKEAVASPDTTQPPA